MLQTFVNFLLNFFSGTGYFGITAMMAIESSFIPFPSEIVIPPAAYLAQKGELNIILVILFGIFGTLIGALVNYFLAMKLGRPIVYKLVNTRIAKILLLNESKIKKSEEYFLKYGNISTFIGRLVPAVRQLISIPAGFSRMNLKKFLVFTTLGSSLWIIILAFFGYQFGANQELFTKIYSDLKIGIIFIIIFFVLVIFIKTLYKKRKQVTSKGN